jgi:hypothetical protein
VNLKKPVGVWQKGVSVLLAVGTTAGLFLVGTAGAASATGTGGGSVSVSATLNGTGDGPVIECSWLVQDLNPNGGKETSNTNTSATDYTGTPPPTAGLPTPPGVNATSIAYVAGSGLLGYPSPITTGAPCTLPTGAESPTQSSVTTAPTYPSSSVVDVTPLAFNAPDQAYDQHGQTPGLRVELWAAVNDTVGLGQINTVDWNVYYPNGTLDVDVHAGAPIEGSSACSAPAASNVLTPMFSQAELDGDITSAAVGSTTSGNSGLLWECNEDSVALFHNAFTISKDDPNGIYKVVADARDQQGNEGRLTYYFQVDPFIAFARDFSSVNFGNILPNIEKTVEGDTNFQPPNSTAPTVTNGGNSGMQIGVQFFPLVGTQPSNTIGTPDSTGNGTFDASLGYNAGFLETLNNLAPASGSAGSSTDQVNWFANSGGQLVCPDDTPKMDFSVTPPGGLTTDTFTGNLVVWFQSARTSVSNPTVSSAGTGYCPTDSGIPYVPVAGDSGTPVRVIGGQG